MIPMEIININIMSLTMMKEKPIISLYCRRYCLDHVFIKVLTTLGVMLENVIAMNGC